MTLLCLINTEVIAIIKYLTIIAIQIFLEIN